MLTEEKMTALLEKLVLNASTTAVQTAYSTKPAWAKYLENLRMQTKEKADDAEDAAEGYRSGHSTDDANHLLLRAIELTLRWQGLPLYLFCLDWKKCYDRIHIDRLLKALQRFGLPDHYLQILRMI